MPPTISRSLYFNEIKSPECLLTTAVTMPFDIVKLEPSSTSVTFPLDDFCGVVEPTIAISDAQKITATASVFIKYDMVHLVAHSSRLRPSRNISDMTRGTVPYTCAIGTNALLLDCGNGHHRTGKSRCGCG